MEHQSNRVVVREVGLRDGLQSIPDVLPTDAKLKWIEAEHAAGVREIEVCSFVPSKLMPQFADSRVVVQEALRIDDLVVAALVPNRRGAETALELGVHKLNYVMSASESHNRANVRRSRDESLSGFEEVATLVKGVSSTALVGCISTAFGCTIEGQIDREDVARIAKRYVELGADEIVLGDTVGYASPKSIQEVVASVKAVAGDIPIALHLHDTRGVGLANVLAGLFSGVRHFDAALAGMGGCPHAPGASGNIVTEDLVFLLESSGWSTGIDLRALIEVRHILKESLPSVGLLGALAKAGVPRGYLGSGLPLDSQT